MAKTKTKTDPRYHWSHPSEWLDHYLEQDTHDRDDLIRIARALAGKLDGDQIQDEFQDEMTEDGYFIDLNKLDTAKCPDCATLLTDATTITVGDTEYPTYCEECDREIELEERK